MKNTMKVCFYLLLILVSCSNCNAEKKIVTNPAEALKTRLWNLKGKGILLGHQDDLAYGMGWSYVAGESDVKRVTGSYPAIVGWDLGGIELGETKNLDNVPFEKMRECIIQHHKRGGINTISWHAFSAVDSTNSWNTETTVVARIIPGGNLNRTFNKHLDKVANFLASLKDEDGNLVPVIFRPWHEMIGSWFWWGQNECSVEEYKALFRYTINYLRNEKNVMNIVIAFSPDRGFDTQTTFMERYPGDDMVDILGVDNYRDVKPGENLSEAIRKLHIVIDAANERKKLAAFAETGLENVTDSLWFTEKLGTVLRDPKIAKEISYVLIWRSDENVHFYFPYPGHPAAKNAKQFADDKNVLLLNDLPKTK